MQHFHAVALFELILTLAFAYYKAYTYMVHCVFLEKHYGKV